MKIFLPTLCLLYCLSSPTYAFAYGCDCGSVQNMITIAKNETISEVNLNTTLEAEAIRSEDLIAFMMTLDALARMETGTSKELNDLYMRMVGAQQQEDRYAHII